MNVAVLDLGTNVFNLLLASFTDSGCRYVTEYKCAARLGAGGLANGLIAPVAFETATAALSSIMGKIEAEGGADRVIPYATSAIRDARNGTDFVKAMNERFGIEINVISGDKEAELIFGGIIESLPQQLKNGEENILMLDIGGGSNEFIISDGRKILWKKSFPIGMARMREKFGYEDPVDETTLRSFTGYCTAELSSLWREIDRYKPKIFVGSSGSFDTFRDVIFNCPRPEAPSMEIPGKCLSDLHSLLLASNSQQRLGMPGMSPIRVDYIVLASVFTQLVIGRLSPRIIYQSSYSLKEGAMRDEYDRWKENVLRKV